MNLGLMKDSVFPQAVRANVNRFNELIFLVARGMDSALPSGPSGAGDGGFGRRPGRFADDRHGGSSSTASGAVAIDQSRLPTCPPYTAFIGNLPFDVTEADVRTFMQMRNIPAASILNVKLPRDNVENKSRGFGYVEFSSCEDLTRALLASNQFSIKNRVVRVDLSDSKPQTERELRPAEANRNWREGAGMAPAGPRSMHAEGRENRPMSAAETSRNWRDGAAPVERTAVFSSNAEKRSEPREPRESRPVEPVRNWRETAKPVEKAAVPAAPVKEIEQVKKPAAPVQSKVPAGSWRREN